jgi:hypothetical protein
MQALFSSTGHLILSLILDYHHCLCRDFCDFYYFHWLAQKFSSDHDRGTEGVRPNGVKNQKVCPLLTLSTKGSSTPHVSSLSTHFRRSVLISLPFPHSGRSQASPGHPPASRAANPSPDPPTCRASPAATPSPDPPADEPCGLFVAGSIRPPPTPRPNPTRAPLPPLSAGGRQLAVPDTPPVPAAEGMPAVRRPRG